MIEPMQNLSDRLEWIAERRGYVSLRRLSLAAGLSHSTLSNAVARERAGGSHNLTTASLRAVASIADVPFEWLMDGGSDPDVQRRADAAPAMANRYAHAEEAIADLISAGWPAPRAREVVGAIVFDESKGEPTALAIVRMAEKVLRSAPGKLGPDETPVGDDEL